MRSMRAQLTFTYEANSQRARKSLNAPLKKRAHTIFLAKTFSALDSTQKFTFIAERALTFAEKKLGLSNRSKASAVIHESSRLTFQQCSASTCAQPSSTMSKRSAI